MYHGNGFWMRRSTGLRFMIGMYLLYTYNPKVIADIRKAQNRGVHQLIPQLQKHSNRRRRQNVRHSFHISILRKERCNPTSPLPRLARLHPRIPAPSRPTTPKVHPRNPPLPCHRALPPRLRPEFGCPAAGGCGEELGIRRHRSYHA